MGHMLVWVFEHAAFSASQQLVNRQVVAVLGPLACCLFFLHPQQAWASWQVARCYEVSHATGDAWAEGVLLALWQLLLLNKPTLNSCLSWLLQPVGSTHCMRLVRLSKPRSEVTGEGIGPHVRSAHPCSGQISPPRGCTAVDLQQVDLLQGHTVPRLHLLTVSAADMLWPPPSPALLGTRSSPVSQRAAA